MTANLVFVLNLIMAAVIVFYKKKNQKTEGEILQRTQSKVLRLELIIWYLQMKTKGINYALSDSDKH